MELKDRLIKEIKSSRVFKFYKFLTGISRYSETYKKIMIALFLIGFIDQIFGGNIFGLNYILFLGIAPGIIFVFLAGTTHFLAGFKISSLAKEFSIDEIELKELIEKNA